MVFGFIFIAATALAIVYLALRSVTNTRTLIVDVVGVIDGRTVEVLSSAKKERVILAGIGFPPGDPRSEQDCHEVVKDIASGRRLYMDVFKEVSGCKYVTLRSANGDCLNAMMLSRGLARYESTGVGYIGPLVEAENEGRVKGLGIWDKHRALFRHLSGSSTDDAFVDSEIDEYAVDRD